MTFSSVLYVAIIVVAVVFWSLALGDEV